MLMNSAKLIKATSKKGNACESRRHDSDPGNSCIQFPVERKILKNADKHSDGDDESIEWNILGSKWHDAYENYHCQ